jgi:hypothetical protein
VPGEVLGFVAGQWKIVDPSSVKRYLEHRHTQFGHADMRT